MSGFKTLSENVLASPQVEAEDIAVAKAQGVTLVINNRPDGEAPDQPPGAEIARAARAEGLAYLAIPVDHSGISGAQIDAMADAIGKAQGKVLAYCRTGTRSTFLWALAAASKGEDPAAIAEAAAAAGYDLSPIGGTLEQLAARPAG
jgi:uncharacterized protein (TIGR01244 family)